MKYPFYLETNATWGKVENDDGWNKHIENVIKLYNYTREEAEAHLLKSRINPRSSEDSLPYFGLYSEYNGPITLREWLQDTND